MLLANFNRKEHLRHRAVSLRQHGFLVCLVIDQQMSSCSFSRAAALIMLMFCCVCVGSMQVTLFIIFEKLLNMLCTLCYPMLEVHVWHLLFQSSNSCISLLNVELFTCTNTVYNNIAGTISTSPITCSNCLRLQSLHLRC